MSNKRLVLFSVALAATALAVLHLALASAEVGIEGDPPVLAAEFGGTVKINGNNVPTDGSVMVAAWINEVRYGNLVQPWVESVSGETVYRISVPGDDPSTPGVIEGGRPGDTVIFRVGNGIGGQAPWENTGGLITLNLTAYTAYVPFISKQ